MRKLCTFSLEIMLNHLNVICDMSHVMEKPVCVNCRMGESGLVVRLAHAQCSVITEDEEQGFSKTRLIFLVYMESYCISVVVNCRP